MFNGVRCREEGNVEENENLEACRSVPKRGDPKGLAGAAGFTIDDLRFTRRARVWKSLAFVRPAGDVALRDFRAGRGWSCRHGFMALVWRLVYPVRRMYAPIATLPIWQLLIN